MRFRLVTTEADFVTRKQEIEVQPQHPTACLAADGFSANALKKVVEQNPTLQLTRLCADERQLLRHIEEANPELLLVAQTDSLTSPLTTVRSVLALNPNVRMVYVLDRPDGELVARLVDAGVRGIGMRNDTTEELDKAVAAAAAGGLYLSRRSAALAAGRLGASDDAPTDRIAALTNREMEVFRLLGLAKQNREIASALSVSVKTVETHKENLKQKLCCTSAPELQAMAHEWLSGRK